MGPASCRLPFADGHLTVFGTVGLSSFSCCHQHQFLNRFLQVSRSRYQKSSSVFLGLSLQMQFDEIINDSVTRSNIIMIVLSLEQIIQCFGFRHPEVWYAAFTHLSVAFKKIGCPLPARFNSDCFKY